jgi:glycosyltransferase involved in cell wall biosynthesis
VTRVLLLIPTLDRSGAEQQLTLLATRLPRDEFDVRVATLTRGGPFEDVLKQAGIGVIHLRKRFKFDPVALWRLRRLLRDWQPHILHTWLFAANAYGRLAVGRHRRCKVIVSERCVDSWKSDWQLWLDRRLVSRTDLLVGNAQSVAEFYEQQGIPKSCLRVVPNGIGLPTDAPPSRKQFLAGLEISQQAKIVGYIGRLAKQKRVRDLIWAFELLRSLHDEVHLLIVGDGPERPALEQFARDIQADRQIHFLGHRHDARQLLPLLDVFWLASEFEGLSNSVMEVMAAGVPVVVSDIPPNRELVVPGETGFVVPLGDRVAFAQFTAKLLTDPELAQRLGADARERIRTEFSIDKMVAGYVKLYRELMKDE